MYVSKSTFCEKCNKTISIIAPSEIIDELLRQRIIQHMSFHASGYWALCHHCNHVVWALTKDFLQHSMNQHDKTSHKQQRDNWKVRRNYADARTFELHKHDQVFWTAFNNSGKVLLH